MIKNTKEIKAHADIEKICSDLGINLKKGTTGNELRAVCPFEEHSKSDSKNDMPFSINLKTSMWKCHACNSDDREGDIFDLVKKINNNSFPDAAKFVAESSSASVSNSFTPAQKIPKQEEPKLTSEQVTQIFDQASPKGEHQYLKAKRVDPCEGLRYGKDLQGNHSIVVPFCNVDGNLQTLQYINERKRFLGGSPYTEAFFTIASFQDGDTVFVSEGLATALTVWMAFDKSVPVISVGPVNNLAKVICALKKKYPQLKIKASLDAGEQPKKEMIKVSKEYPDVEFAEPSFEGLSFGQDVPKDFNDLVSICNQPLTVVKEQLMNLKKVTELKPFEQAGAIAEAPQADAMPSLINDIELDIIKYMLANSFEKINLDDLLSTEELSPDLFNGNVIKDGKNSLSLNRMIAELIKKHWEANDASLVPLPSEIALSSGKYAEEIHNILKSLENKPIPSVNQIHKRLDKLKSTSAVKDIESLLQKIKEENIPAKVALDMFKNLLERNEQTTQVVQSDNFYEAQMLVDEETEKKEFIQTEFDDFNFLLKGGLRGGKLIVLQGKAGAGKSTFMFQLKDHLAGKGIPVSMVAMEQSRKELREISLIRLEHMFSIKNNDKKADSHYQFYAKKIQPNLYTIEGLSHTQISSNGIKFLTIGEIVSCVMKIMQLTGKKPVLFIDPFQRCTTGVQSIDSNEYDRINVIIALLKCYAHRLGITIIVSSDVTKDHSNNLDGEGAGRGSYMIQHFADMIITFKESENSPFEALFGIAMPADIDAEDKTKKTIYNKQQKKLWNVFKNQEFEKEYYLPKDNDNEVWLAACVSKNRGGEKRSMLFMYRKDKHYFEGIPLWTQLLKWKQ